MVILDRDGTIIVDREYLSDPAGVELENGALEGLQQLVAAGAMLIVVSNQSGVGRGYFDEAAVAQVNAWTATLLANEGVRIAGWYVCPHVPDAACNCRKPAPGLVDWAAGDLGFNPAEAYFVGDKASDLGLATTTGGTAVLVLTGHGTFTAQALAPGAALMGATLIEAAALIIADFRRREMFR